MTTLYEEASSVGPGTHVLAIGVGKYPHLIGGGGRLASRPLGLKNITSPAISARDFIKWCLAPQLTPGAMGFENADCPLASVEGLISASAEMSIAAPSGTKVLEAATRANIKDAFIRWLGRLRSHPDNIGVFYFCGHGMMVADQHLLAEDFGVDDTEPWGSAFNVSKTIRAVDREIKGTVYVLLDACRQVKREVALTEGGDPTALYPADLTKSVIRKSRSLIEATGETMRAFGADGEVSRFTSALITALSGYCGAKSPGSRTWDVDGEIMASAIRKLLEKANKTAEEPQVSAQTIEGTLVPLIRRGQIPKVKVDLDFAPEHWRAAAKLALTSAMGATTLRHDFANGAFRQDVPRGYYVLGASAQAGEFHDLTYDDQDLAPPVFDLTLEAKP